MSTLCEHVSNYKNDKGLTTYRIIQAYFVTCVSISARKKKAIDAYCRVCKTRTNRIHACLSCVFFGCFDKDHARNHAISKNHDISIDIKTGQIFCFKCNDFTYDEDFEKIAGQYKINAGRAKGYEIYLPWEPKPNEIQILKENNGLKKISDDSYIGLRGLVNLGNTCFVNCIIQVLVHIPMMRDYFLSDKHIHEKENNAGCLGCEMFNTFQEFYSGLSKPHIPYKLVYLTWVHSKAFIGFDQQDAHEFLVTFIENLHYYLHNKETDEKMFQTVNHCSCIVHLIFTGFYQSDVYCAKCSYVSTSIDPFVDISLDMSGTSGNKNVIDLTPESLIDCLERYTSPENLVCTPCSHCQHFAAMKQLTLKKLPVVLCFHLKRLSASQSKHKVCNKNTRHVIFPELIDMSPFISTTCGERNNLPIGNHSRDLHNTENMYSLFGVVSHRGDQAGGHYIAYIRQHRDRWFLCDDDVIMKSSLDEVLESEGYLLFYHKQVLEYETIQQNKQPFSPAADVKEENTV